MESEAIYYAVAGSEPFEVEPFAHSLPTDSARTTMLLESYCLMTC